MAVDYYLKVDGMPGEATTKNFQDQIRLLSFSWGGSQTSSVAGNKGSGAGKVDLAGLSVTKELDKASPKLFNSLCSGTHIKSATLSATKAGAGGGTGGVFLKITLGELFVTSLHTSAASEIPTESVSFSYNTIRIEYSTQDDNGVLTVAGDVSYDLKANTVS
jgi:type VI secretion system secreted protein Hcp